MKKTVLSICLAISLFANETNSANKEVDPSNMNPLQLFLFKIGYNALISDFENEKNKSEDLHRRVQNIEESIVVLLKKLQEMELKKPHEELSLNENSTNVDELKEYIKELKEASKELKETPTYQFLALREDIAKLKAEMEYLKTQRVQKSSDANFKYQMFSELNTTTYKVISNKLFVKEKPIKESGVIAELSKDSVIKIEYCDRYDWCKLKDSDGFVGRHLIMPIIDENLSNNLQ